MRAARLLLQAATREAPTRRAASLAEVREPLWHVVDARGQHVGRLASRLATVLVGKHKPIWEPHRHEHGDFVVVLNAAEVEFTGKKWTRKVYYRHSGYPGGLKRRTAAEVHQKKPGEVLRRAVYGMLPKNKLRDIFADRLKIYAGDVHPHSAQLVGLRAAASPLADLVLPPAPFMSCCCCSCRRTRYLPRRRLARLLGSWIVVPD